MPKHKLVPIRTLAEIANSFRAPRYRSSVKFEYATKSGSGILSDLRYARNLTTGRPTRTLIDCVDNGKPMTYDKNFEFTITAMWKDEQRHEIPGRSR